MPSESTVEELRTILLEDYQQEVTQQEAHDLANSLVRYFGLLAEVDAGDGYEG